MDQRAKKHGWLFWTTVALIALAGLYILSFGPACWMRYNNFDRWMAVNALYRPLLEITRRSEAVRWGLERYANLIRPPGAQALIDNGTVSLN